MRVVKDGRAKGMDEFLPLLENSYQTMQSGALALLDKYKELTDGLRDILWS